MVDIQQENQTQDRRYCFGSKRVAEPESRKAQKKKSKEVPDHHRPMRKKPKK
jgi:hypothetical protein